VNQKLKKKQKLDQNQSRKPRGIRYQNPVHLSLNLLKKGTHERKTSRRGRRRERERDRKRKKKTTEEMRKTGPARSIVIQKLKESGTFKGGRSREGGDGQAEAELS